MDVTGRTVHAAETMLAPATQPTCPVVERLRRELHRVHGTVGTYGFTEASQLAARLEEQAARWAAAPHLDVERRAAIVEHFVMV